MTTNRRSFLDLSPSRICLGTGDLGSTVDKDSAFTLLDAFLDLGGNFLDTAKVYADWLPGERSISEKTIGTWMHQRNNRARVILGTKGAHPDLNTMHISRLSRAEIESDLHASLRNFQTDVIDMYWLHRDEPARPVEDILTTLNEAVKAGKIRYFGCSNWKIDRIRQANEYAEQHGLLGFAADQPMWNMAVVDKTALADPSLVIMNKALWDYHRTTNLPVIPFSASANGLFQKLARMDKPDLDLIPQKHYRSPANLKRLERARRLADRRGLTITQVVLGYLLSQPFPTIPIVSTKKLDHLQEILASSNVRLESTEIEWIEAE